MKDSPDQSQADDLGAFGDALVAGHAPPPTTDIERTMVRAYRAAQERDEVAAEMPARRKQQIWEDLMTTQNATVDRIGRVVPDRPAPANRFVPSAFPSPRSGWQAVASFALVLAVLAALVTLAWQQGTGGGSDEPTAALGAQALYDSNDPSTYPRVPEKCIPNGDVPSDAELSDRSIDDWPAPQYTPAKMVSYQKGEAILDTYLHFLRCQEQAFDKAYPPGSTPPVGPGTPVPPLVASPVMRTYFSDRLRFDHLYGSLSAEQQAGLDAWRCEPRVNRILETFPLPVNQPNDFAVKSLLANGDIDELAGVFSPSDVYLMPDGRYGVVMGTVSTAALTDPDAVTRDDWLTFIAFEEVDGTYYIDEMFTLLASDMDRIFPEGRDGTIRMDCD